jgi:hypothetical protein
MPIEDNAPAVGRDHSGDAVEQRGLARTIGTDKARDAVRRDIE